jgi:hypothetical protein
MKIGQQVNFYDPAHGKAQPAVVVDIVGASDNLAKVLNLQVGTKKLKVEGGEEQEVPNLVENVCHGTNATAGEAFWLIPVIEKVPAHWAEHDEDAGPVVPMEGAALAPTTVIEQAAAVTADARKRSRSASR